jgi:hypothetical protein
MNKKAEYEKQIAVMSAQARKWVAAHPQAKPVVSYSYPPEVAVIADIEDAIKSGLVVADADGLALIKAACAGFDEYLAPTVLMLRAALDIATKKGDQHD